MRYGRQACAEMLPEFPLLKETFSRAIIRVIAARIKAHLGIFGDIPRARMFEGRASIIVRSDGTEDPTAMREGSAEIEISLDELKDLTLQQLMDKLDMVAWDMARQQSLHLFSTLDEGWKKAGTTIDGQGGPLTSALFLAMLEKIWINFIQMARPECPQ